MKYRILLFGLWSLILSCGSPINSIPLENIYEHRQFLENRTSSKIEDFYSYEKLLKKDPTIGESPFIFYYLSRLENQRKYLDMGLQRFPNDPYINFNRKKYLNDEEKVELYKEILRNHPKHNLSLVNYLNSFDDLLSKDFQDSDLRKNSSLLQEIHNYIVNYENGDTNTSKYYDLSHTNLRLGEYHNSLLNNKIGYVKSLIGRLNVILEKEKKERERKNRRLRELRECITMGEYDLYNHSMGSGGMKLESNGGFHLWRTFGNPYTGSKVIHVWGRWRINNKGQLVTIWERSNDSFDLPKTSIMEIQDCSIINHNDHIYFNGQ